MVNFKIYEEIDLQKLRKSLKDLTLWQKLYVKSESGHPPSNEGGRWITSECAPLSLAICLLAGQGATPCQVWSRLISPARIRTQAVAGTITTTGSMELPVKVQRCTNCASSPYKHLHKTNIDPSVGGFLIF